MGWTSFWRKGRTCLPKGRRERRWRRTDPKREGMEGPQNTKDQVETAVEVRTPVGHKMWFVPLYLWRVTRNQVNPESSLIRTNLTFDLVKFQSSVIPNHLSHRSIDQRKRERVVPSVLDPKGLGSSDGNPYLIRKGTERTIDWPTDRVFVWIP